MLLGMMVAALIAGSASFASAADPDSIPAPAATRPRPVASAPT